MIIKSFSLKTRLTLFYGCTTALLLIITGLFLYGMTIHILHKANHQFLSDEIGVLENLLQNQPEKLLALKQELIETPYTETDSEYRYYIRILDQTHNVILETPFFNQTFQQSPLFQRVPEGPKKENVYWRSGKSHYVLMQTKSEIGNTRTPILIQVALDITYQQKVIAQYSQLLAIILFSVMVIAILLGFFIAHRAMKSLDRLTEATQKITVTSLHKRIDPNSWPKELRSLGIAFNEMLARIENAFLHLTQFSADLAHELRSPINNLMGEAEIILSRPHTLNDYQHVLESHMEELQRIAQLIENILFLARAENPKLDIQKEWIHVANEITLISEFYQAIADEKLIQITSEGDASLFVNAIMFRRMLSNLLSNALKYSSSGGVIQFETRQINQTIEIKIKDNGIGIASEHLPKLFNRFYRVDSARTRSEGGVGLGLAIVKSIVELHQGSITIASELEVGTVITLLLPV